MTPQSLNNLLKRHGFGSGVFADKNRLFDEDYTPVPKKDFGLARLYANNKMAWYFTDTDKHYLRADCNRFAWMWLGYFQEWFTKNRGYSNPAIGRCYGHWQGVAHSWAWVVVGNELEFINWGQVVSPSQVNYSGKGASAV